MNWGLSDKIMKEFPSVIPAIRPVVNFEGITDPNLLAGFVDGEGCFYGCEAAQHKKKLKDI